MAISNDILGPFENDNAVNVRDLLDMIDQLRLRLEAFGIIDDAIHDDLDDLEYMIVNHYDPK
jgi:hypothetical protein